MEALPRPLALSAAVLLFFVLERPPLLCTLYVCLTQSVTACREGKCTAVSLITSLLECPAVSNLFIAGKLVSEVGPTDVPVGGRLLRSRGAFIICA